MTVRSGRLAEGRTGAGATTVVYTAPTVATIVRSFGLRAVGAGGVFTIKFRVGTTGTLRDVLQFNAVLNQVFYQETWFVLETGDQIAITTAAAQQVDYWISGPELV